jgi:hypothetical protein
MTELYPYDPETLAHLVSEADAVEQAVRESVHEALLMHKRLGNPVAAWRNGQVVWIPADEIPLNSAQQNPATFPH